MAGFNLPPGVTTAMIDRAAGVGAMCECCGNTVEDCFCPECPVCEVAGEPNCYHENVQTIGHGLKFTAQQLIGQTKVKIQNLQDLILAEQQYIEWLNEHQEHTEHFHG